MPRTGRPKLPEQQRKAHMFRVRMTDADRAQIDRAAETAGESASEWARKILLRAAQRQRKK